MMLNNRKATKYCFRDRKSVVGVNGFQTKTEKSSSKYPINNIGKEKSLFVHERRKNSLKECSVVLDRNNFETSSVKAPVISKNVSYSQYPLSLIKPCSVVLEDCAKSLNYPLKKCCVLLDDILKKNEKILPLPIFNREEVILNNYISSDHVNKFNEILTLETSYKPIDVLLIWHIEEIESVNKSLPHIQLLPASPTENITHWICTYFDGNAINIYDSLNSNLSSVQQRFLNRLFPWKPRIVYKEVQKQPNSYDCGVFAIAFATTIALGKDPSRTVYDHRVMRSHLLDIFLKQKLMPFPSVEDYPKSDDNFVS